MFTKSLRYENVEYCLQAFSLFSRPKPESMRETIRVYIIHTISHVNLSRNIISPTLTKRRG